MIGDRTESGGLWAGSVDAGAFTEDADRWHKSQVYLYTVLPQFVRGKFQQTVKLEYNFLFTLKSIC